MANFFLEPRLAKVGIKEGSIWPSSSSSPGSPRLAKVKEAFGRFPLRVQARQGWPNESKILANFPLEPRPAKVGHS